ncbi:MAG: hypothetical protein ACOC56_02130 [Atribacterota bacterium]
MTNKKIIFEKPLFISHKYSIVEVDVKKIDNNWKNDIFYIGNEFKINNKYRQSFNYINKYNKCAVPHIGFDSSGIVGFYDGRHRFAVLRDMGIKKIFVAVFYKDLDRLVKYFS